MKKLFIVPTIALVWLTANAQAAAVGPAGYSTDFASAPDAIDWSTRGIPGAVADIATSNDLQTAVQLLTASSITAPLSSSSTNPPGALATAVYGEAGYVQTRPNNVSYTALMATLHNTTGSNVTSVHIRYSFTANLASAESVPGQQVYFSLTGASGSWVNIPQFSSAPAGPLSATISAAWNEGSPLYLLFADDNGPGTDTACQIDNLSVTTSGGSTAAPRVTITAPLAGTTLVQGVDVTVSAVASSGIDSVSFYDGATLIGTSATVPFSVVHSNLAVGAHALRAVGNGSVTSAVVNINIVANHPPTVALTTTPGGTVLVGSNIVNAAVVTDTDPGGSVVHVEFYLDGALKFTDPNFPYSYDYCDATAGSHVIRAVAVDQFGGRGTNSTTLVATNPADVTVIIPNGSTWNYFDQGVDQGTAWRELAFDDTGWSNGVAELGYGDGEGRRPERTVIGFGTNSLAKYPTTYFRKVFNVADASAYANLIVRLLRDDGGIVYLNGVEVFRSYMTNGPVGYETLAGPAGAGPQVDDDGTFYQVTSANPALLVSGPNIVAVEIHQEDPGSSDISFDLMLWGQGFAGRTLTISAPAAGTSLVQGVDLTVSATFSGGVNSVSFYDGATLIGTDPAAPFSIVHSNLALGAHALKAVGNGGVTSAVVNISIVANHAPTVALTMVPGGTVLVGSNIVNSAVVTDTDPGGSIARVEFFVDGTLKFTDDTFPYNFDYCDPTAGLHLIQAVAVDHFGARATNTKSLMATNPAGVTVLIANGATWKYFDQGVDQGTAWRELAFDDTGWSNGVAELGYGDGEGRRPETTVIGFGTNSLAKYPTTYFRKVFNVADASVYANLIVRLLRDDGGIVYLNGVEVFRSYMTNGPVGYETLAGPAGAGPQVDDDGTFYQVTSANPALLVNGPNIVAVEIHQEDPSSSDISFDLMLWGQGFAGRTLTINSPVAGTSLVEGVDLTVSATFSGGVNSVSFYDGVTLIGTDLNEPFSVVYSNLVPRVHALKAVGNGGVESPVVNINILANHPPTVALTTVPGGTVLVGSNIVNTAVVTDTDPGGSIARVEFYLDGVLKFGDANPPYNYDYSDATAGSHLIQAVAVDHFGARGTNSNSLTASPPSNVTVIIPNGSTWKYFDRGIDQGTAWRALAFDDTGWSNGVAELGYGDGEGRRPETTVVGFGTNSEAKYPTTYFRKTFTVTNASVYANLIVRLLRDDGGIVYLNGVEVFRSYMTNGPVSYATLAGPAGAGPQVEDDGTFYQVTNANPALLVNGPNIVAVEIHQEDLGSSDISFDLMLWGQGPSLTIRLLNETQADVSWLFPSTGYVLKSKANLEAAMWDVVTDPDSPNAGFHHVLINRSSGRRFFRLEHP